MNRTLLIAACASLFTLCAPPQKETTSSDKPAPITEQPEQEEEKLQTVAEFTTRPGNVAVSQEDRVFTTMHPLDPSDFQLVEVTGGTHRAFPNTDMQKNGGAASAEKLDTPLGIRIDQNNVLWIIDMGQNLGITRLFGFNIANGEEVFRLDFPEEVAPAGSFIQDLAVDEQNGWVFLADIANPGILAVDMQQKTVRRFTDKTVEAEDVDMVIHEKVIHFGGAPARVAVNPITLSHDRNTLFFGAMNGTQWYSVPTQLFRDAASDANIAAAIQVVGDKPISDGAATDESGQHYFTNLQEFGIDVLSPEGELQPVIRDPSIDWPDNVAVGSDGSLYIVINQLFKAPAFTGGADAGKPPYFIKKLTR
ncbi:MAG: L-dopachrome tautomerase-related protein [Salibacteraceae bacterium]